MSVGLNARYIYHSLRCTNWVPKSLRLLVFTAFLTLLVIGLPIVTGYSVPGTKATLGTGEDDSVNKTIHSRGVATVDRMLTPYNIEPELRRRIAQAVISSSRKHDVDPMLVTSIILVESSGNPFAVSQASSVGIMQVHMPTWATLIEEQGINVFRLEDNIDLGVRILKGYIDGHGLWEGVARYKGMVDTPESKQAAAEYVAKIQQIYGLDPEQASLRD
jgi:hypothetical protein